MSIAQNGFNTALDFLFQTNKFPQIATHAPSCVRAPPQDGTHHRWEQVQYEYEY